MTTKQNAAQLVPKHVQYTKATRNNFFTKEKNRVLPPISDYVKTRNVTTFKVRPVSDRFIVRYKHGLDNLNRGHYSKHGEPYKILGDFLYYDPREIILEHMKDKLDEKSLYKLQEALMATSLLGRQSYDPKGQTSGQDDEQPPKLGDLTKKSVLWSFIQDSEKLMDLVKGNACYYDLLREIMIRRSLIPPKGNKMDSMIIETLTSGINTPVEVQLEKDDTLNIPELSDKADEVKDESSDLEAMPSYHHEAASIDSEQTLASTRKFQRLSGRMNILKSIHYFLDLMYNIPLKYLRNKTPLSQEMLKSLQTDGKRSMSPHGGNSETSSNEGKLTKERSYSMTNKLVPENTFLPRTSDQTASTPKTSNNCIETWDELVALYDKRKKCQTLKPLLSLFNQNEKKMNKKMTSDRMVIMVKQELSRKNTPWQVIMNEKTSSQDTIVNFKKKKNPLEKTPKRSVITGTRFRLYHMGKIFRSKECNMEDRLLETLQKNDRKKLSNLQVKLNVLQNLKTTDFYHKYRLSVKNINKEAVIHVDDTEQSDWYIKLKNENSKIARDEFEFKDIMQKIFRFNLTHSSNPYFAKAKLCLIVMSLAMNDLLQIHTQKALKFISEDILICDDDIVKEWLSMRGIPCVPDLGEETTVAEDEKLENAQHRYSPY